MVEQINELIRRYLPKKIIKLVDTAEIFFKKCKMKLVNDAIVTLSVASWFGVKKPGSCVMEIYTQTLIIDAKIWLNMMEMRNRTSQTYDESDI